MSVIGLEENLHSVRQMIEHGYYLLFGGDVVYVFDSHSLDSLVVKVKMTSNRCFPLTIMHAYKVTLRASITHYSQTWHKRLGHLNEKSLRLPQVQEMVHGLPHLNDTTGVCQRCMIGKQH